jgi:hypothetical protein
MCYNLLVFFEEKMEFEMIKERRPSLSTFYWFGRTSVLCLRTREGSKPRSSGLKLTFDLLCVFYLIFEKVLKWKAKWQMRIGLYFLYWKKNRLKVWLKLIWYLIKKENKKDDHLIENQGLLWKYFCDFWFFECFCCFGIINEN